MNVLIVSQYFWPESFLVNDLAAGLMERGHRVTVLTGKPNYPGGKLFPGYGLLKPVREDYEGARVLRVPLAPRGAGGKVGLVLNYFSYALFASLLGPILCRGRYDLIFVYEPSPITVGVPAAIMKLFKRAPIMFWVQDLWPESLSATGAVRSPVVLRQVEKLVRGIYRTCNLILVTSRGFVSGIKTVGGDVSKVRYWPQWAEALYRPVALEEGAEERDELPSGFRVVFGGNLGAAQSFETILAAAENLADRSDIHWVVLGEGRMRSQVEEHIERSGLKGRVHLLGARPPEQMPRYFALADALLVTLKDEEIFSLTVPGKVQSYLACGRPIVAALEGEGARVVRDSGAGLVAPAEDADALAERVLDLYRMSPEKREEMGYRGRAYFEEHFEREKLLDRLEGWMSELVRK